MEYYRYQLPVNSNSIKEHLIDLLSCHDIDLPDNRLEFLFRHLDNRGIGVDSPFPLVNTVTAAQGHAELLRLVLDGEITIERSQYLVASLYGFPAWDYFIKAVKGFEVGVVDPFMPYAMLSPPYIDPEMLEVFPDCDDRQLPLSRFHEIRDRREAGIHADQLERKIDWGLPIPEWSLDSGYPGGRVAPLLTELFYQDLAAWELFLIGLSPQKGRNAPKAHIMDTASDYEEYEEYWDRFADLIKDPIPARLAEWPEFSEIHNIEKIIRNGVRVRKSSFLRDASEADYPQIMLYKRQAFECPDGETFNVDSWVSLSHDLCDTPFKEEDAQHWNYVAHFLLSDPKPGQNPILCVTKGYYFVPYKGEKCGTHENFLRMVGSASPELDRIADVISQMLPELGYNGVFDFYKQRGAETGILVANPVIHPDYRAKGWVTPLLQMLARTISDAPRNIVIESVEDPLCFLRYRTVEGKEVYSPWMGIPSIVLMPSLGSPGEPKLDIDDLNEYGLGFDYPTFLEYYDEKVVDQAS